MKRLNTILFFIAFSGLSISLNAQNNVSLNTFRTNLQGLVDNATSNLGIEGMELSIILDDNTNEESFYSGLRAPGMPIDTLKSWHFAGETAGLTNYVIFKLIEEGSLNLDDSIAQHMDAAAMGLNGSITVRELVGHTSVLNDVWNTSLPSSFFQHVWINSPEVFACPEEVLNFMEPEKASPGVFDFNNTNLYVLGFLIDSITGNSFETEFQNRIFNPLGMTESYMSSCDTVTIDSINGIWTNASGYANNRPYTHYFSTSGANRGLISKTNELATFYRALFKNQLLPVATMDSIKKEIQGSFVNLGQQVCASNISLSSGFNTDILRIIFNNNDTTFLYGKGGVGMNSSLSLHWPEKNWTISFAQNNRSRSQEQLLFTIDLFCYLQTIDSVIIPAQAPPVAGFNFSANGPTYTFTDTSNNNPNNWVWDFGDGSGSQSQSPVHTYTSNGTYTVSLIAINALGSDTATSQVIVSTIGLNTYRENKIDVYPNPSSGIINIQLDKNDVHGITLYELSGKIIHELSLEKDNRSSPHYEIPHYIKNGNYILRIATQEGVQNNKLMIQR